MTGLGVAKLLRACSVAGFDTVKSSISWTILPLCSSTPITRKVNSPFLAGVAVVSQILPSAITGDDHPFPGMATSHTLFSRSLQEIGILAVTCPCPSGPRNCGHGSDDFI